MWKIDPVRTYLFNGIEGRLAHFRVFTIHGIIQSADDPLICHRLEIGQRPETYLGLTRFERLQKDIPGRPAAWDAYALFTSELDKPGSFRWRGNLARHARICFPHLFQLFA